MARTPGIQVEGVWKRFRRTETHDSLRDLLPALARRALGRQRPEERAPRDERLDEGEFWALRDVSFSVAPGEALGLIGANGSGKSTMLRLLTRVLGPTRGSFRVTGRVGALVELSAGFHPDLTGRENVFLQGAIMGMRRRDVASVFDRIVDFAGVEPFIDTPVKRYSTGMQARLGFALAAHLDPDVLIIDEVLAVGDTAFQEKALKHVAALVKTGIPVVIVSHQLEQITALCTKAVVLEHGRVIAEGPAVECVETYLHGLLAESRPPEREGAVIVSEVASWPSTTVRSGERLTIGMHCQVREASLLEHEVLAVRVRAAATGAVVYETDVVRAETDVPHDGWYWLDVSLQFNVAPGHYAIEPFTRSLDDDSEISRGPEVLIDVTRGVAFLGTVQMNPDFQVTHAQVYGAENDWAAPARAVGEGEAAAS